MLINKVFFMVVLRVNQIFIQITLFFFKKNLFITFIEYLQKKVSNLIKKRHNKYAKEH